MDWLSMLGGGGGGAPAGGSPGIGGSGKGASGAATIFGDNSRIEQPDKSVLFIVIALAGLALVGVMLLRK